MNEIVHLAEGNEPMRDGYVYSAQGVGVRKDLVRAVLHAWARISPTGDPVLALRSVNDGYINSIDNIARLAVEAVAEGIARESAP